MLLSYDEYTEHYGGKVEEMEFTNLEMSAELVIEAFVHDYVARHDIKPLAEYHLDLKKAIALQVDFIDSVGGISAINGGNSSLDITSVETSGFKYGYGNSQGSTNGREELRYMGLPFSPLVRSIVYNQLRILGYTKLKVNQRGYRTCV